VFTDEEKPLFPSMALDQKHDRVYQDLATVDIKAVPCVAEGATTQPAQAELVLTNGDASKIVVLARAQTHVGGASSDLRSLATPLTAIG
jgi:hypothetical protein